MENRLEEQPIVGSDVAGHAVDYLLALIATTTHDKRYHFALSITDAVYLIRLAENVARQEEMLYRAIKEYRQL